MYDVQQDFAAAVKAAPEDVRGRVCEFTSSGHAFAPGRWVLRDANGVVLWKSYDDEVPAQSMPMTKAREARRLPQPGTYITKIMRTGYDD